MNKSKSKSKSKSKTQKNTKLKNLIPGFIKRKSYKPRMRRNIKISQKKKYEIHLGKLDNSISTTTIGSYVESHK